MRAVVQRVNKASVEIEKRTKGKINKGLLIFLGIEEADGQEDIKWLSRKIANMRIFSDENNAMNLSVKKIDGEALVISQFTLHASTRKGNRPSFIKAAKPDHAEPLYEEFISALQKHIEKPIATGEFGADMQVSLHNDGPVTIIIDSKDKA